MKENQYNWENFYILSAGPGFGKMVKTNNCQAQIYIFKYLDIKDLISLAFTNKTMYKLVFKSMYNMDARFVRSLDLYLCYLKYMIDFEFDNSNNEHFFNIVYKTSSSDFKLLINCLSQEPEDVQKSFGVKFELNANTGKKSPTYGPSIYFILQMYFCRMILIDLLSISVEDFYNAVDDLCKKIDEDNQDKKATKLLSFDEVITLDNVLSQILQKNSNKRIGRLCTTSDKKELFVSKSFWDEIKKIRRGIVHDKLIKRIKRSKNIYLDGIYYWLVLRFIDRLIPDIQKADPYLHFLKQTEDVSFCLKEIKRCWIYLFGFLLTNPNIMLMYGKEASNRKQ